jgi:hypothetical protein
MYKQTLKLGLQKTSAFFVSFMMIISLSLPLTVRAEGSEPPQNPQVSETTDTSKTPSSSEETSSTQPESATSQLQATTEATPQAENAPVPQTSTNVESTAPTTQSNAQTSTSLTNAINSDATSGNASADQNTTVGDITSGNAAALATIVNLLQSSVNLNGAQPITFVQDVTGTVHGDLIVDLAVIAALGTNSNLFGTNNGNVNADASTQANITNAINVTANSGNATANQNTTAGNLQTGSASAVANVVNLINSAINANQSFVGMINIYGDLQGNILVPEAFVNSVLGTGTNVDPTTGPIITTDNNASVTNNVVANANSGNATATDNSHTGNIGTGQANTNVTILNLTSSQTIGKNALLVFVNVMGSWVGLIMDAPAGTTSASLGGNTGGTNTPSGTVNNETNYQINNAINANANSGNATANENTRVGNIQTGNTNAGVNLLNIMNSQISLSDWFGILFINVFGKWNGNFGVQTATVIPPTDTGSGGSGGGSSNGSSTSPAVFKFVPVSQQNYSVRSFGSLNSTVATSTSPEVIEQTAVLGSTNSHNRTDKINLQTGKDTIEEQGLQWWWLPLILLIAAILAARYYIVARRRNSKEEDNLL